MIAQGAHATWLFYLNTELSGEVGRWFATGMKKICVRADSEEQLLGLHKAAQEAGLRSYLITDAGRTEFHGVPTVTCLAIGPNEDSDVDKVTGGLTLL